MMKEQGTDCHTAEAEVRGARRDAGLRMIGTWKALRTSVVPEDTNFQHLECSVSQDSRAVVGTRSDPAASKSIFCTILNMLNSQSPRRLLRFRTIHFPAKMISQALLLKSGSLSLRS